MNNKIVLGLVVGIMVLMYFKCFMNMQMSGYDLSPVKLEVSNNVKGSDLNKLPHSTNCVPGSEKGGYYSKDLTPGGFCGDQELVRSSMSYKITSGIGGSLL